MGTEIDKKGKINNEYINFEYIQESLGIKNPKFIQKISPRSFRRFINKS